MSCAEGSLYFRNLEKARKNTQDGMLRKALEYLRPLEPLPAKVMPQGGPSGRIEALVLDIYGTLFISGSGDIGLLEGTSGRDERLEGLLLGFGVRQEPQQVVSDLKLAISKEHERARKAGIEHPEVVIEDIWLELLGFRDRQTAKRFALCFELLTNPVWPMPFLQELISGCVSRQIVLGIISNAQFYTPLLFEWFLGQDLPRLGFDPQLLFFSYRQRCAKPAPDMFRKAVDVLAQKGIAAGRTLYLGNDMLNDVLPAKQCGFQAALFAGDRRSLRLRSGNRELAGLEPDWTVTDLCQVIRGLKNSSRPAGMAGNRKTKIQKPTLKVYPCLDYTEAKIFKDTKNILYKNFIEFSDNQVRFSTMYIR